MIQPYQLTIVPLSFVMRFNHPVIALPTAFVIVSAILVALFPAQVFSQVSGSVLDENGEPLPYASVYVRNSTNGTVSNDQGEYRLNVPRGTHEIVFQYIGYKQKVEQVEIGDKAIRLTVRMEPSALQISEVVITTEDPAYPIMRKAIEKRAYYKNRTQRYSCDVYIKGFHKLLDAPKKILGQDIGDIGGILDSNRTGVLYLSESVSKLYVQARPLQKKEVMISSKVSGNTNGFSLNRATLTDFSLYEERLNIERDILSPLADNAFSYYRFRLLGKYKDENGFNVYKIAVLPKRDEDPTFHGNIYIVDDYWNLAGVDLRLTGKAIQQPILDTLAIQQEFVPVNRPDEWCLLSQLTSFKFAVLGFKVTGFFNGVFSNYDLNPDFSGGFFDRETFKIESDAVERDSAYWEAVRPVPLTEEQRNDYVKKDSLEQIWESEAYLDSIDRKNNRFKPSNLLFGYSWRNSHKHTVVSYPAVFEGLQFNTVQGLLINFKPTFRHSDGERRSRFFQATGSLNYGFAEKRLRPAIELRRRFENIYYSEIAVSGGQTAVQYDEDGQIGAVTNLLYSLFDKRNYLKLWEKTYGRISAGRNIAPGLRLSGNVEFAERRALVNHSDYSFYKGGRAYSSNSPLPVPVSEPEIPFFNTHRAFIVGISARIRFGETYSSYPDFRVYHRSKWPEVSVQYTKAIPGVGRSEIRYDLAQIEVRQRDLSLGLFGYSDWNLGAGVFWNAARVELMDYFHPKGNQTILGRPDWYTRGFFLLPYYEYSTADAYTYLHWRHHLNGWLLDKIPVLRKLNWKEAIGFGLYYAEHHAWELQQPATTLPYWEFSVGLYNIGIKFFRPLHIDLAFGYFDDQHYRTGLVIGVDL
ncbi:MAG: carboxypeptidase-like regulatory domain-containing protein [Bacteroidetes bacterium]|nr:MAG: carboxypeptidase-like regulatory domain-containing protein [Bacteroidota bacterium]